MAIKTVLFDLDGTLLPMEQEQFARAYVMGLAQKAVPNGYEPDKLIKTILAGTAAMVKNTGAQTNAEVFWAQYTQVYGEQARADEEMFAGFYHNEFQQIQAICGYQPRASELIALLRSKGKQLVLATNPLFPAIATESRIRWAGLRRSDFAYCSTYENSHYCKPNLDYYREILDKLELAPQECLMVGNDVGEDMVVQELGMQVFLLTDCLINQKKQDLTQYPHGDFSRLMTYVQTEI